MLGTASRSCVVSRPQASFGGLTSPTDLSGWRRGGVGHPRLSLTVWAQSLSCHRDVTEYSGEKNPSMDVGVSQSRAPQTGG